MKAVPGMIFLLLALDIAQAQVTEITYPKGSGYYEIALLDLALSRTVAEDGPYRLKSLNLNLTDTRTILSLRDGLFDVTFMVLTPDREGQVLPIRIDLTRGIQGLRLFLIRKEMAKQFASVTNLADLRTRFTAGFGAQWGDLGVLETNGFRVETSAEGKNLYTMLQNRRFDFFPRGINEIWDNLDTYRAAAPDMAVEEHLALYYPMVQCFVVAKTNPDLALRIKRGLERVLADGSMKKLFLAFHEKGIRQARIEGRTVFELKNPELPLGGPRVDTSWWLPEK